ncbi:hypothetical protein F5Y01DRAFT_318110 [Xylaria sp. FL0043]|nr:hypothetical protein F5Y01DRAFT_318110 [Xylaria sp. FL0043]
MASRTRKTSKLSIIVNFVESRPNTPIIQTTELSFMMQETPIATSFIAHLRQASRVSCPVVGCGDAFPAIDDRIGDHLTSKHLEYIKGKDLYGLIRDVKRRRAPLDLGSLVKKDTEPAVSTDDAVISPRKKRFKYSLTSIQKSRAQSTSPPRRSRARPQSAASPDPDFLRRAPQQGKLWDPELDRKPSSCLPEHPSIEHRTEPSEEDIEVPRRIKQPETHPISQEQLVAEVKGIYAGLMMVESKCIEVDNAQSAQVDTKLNNEKLQALIALHRALLHEQHDFFLASQHPSASQALKQLTSKYAMPARLWRHGIYNFLEVLRHCLPGSLDHMLPFIHFIYSMMALLYKTDTAPDTGIEAFGDIGQSRASIEDLELREQEVWASVSRHLYDKVMEQGPEVRHLHHHSSLSKRTATRLCPFSHWIYCLYTPVQSGGLHNSRSNELLPPDYYPGGNPRKASTLEIRVDIPLNELWSNYHNVIQSSLDLTANCYLKSAISRWMRQTERTLKYYIWLLVPSLACPALASVPNNLPHSALGSGQLEQPKGASDDSALVWFWYPTVIVGILVGEFAAVHILDEPLLLHGVSMGISAGAFLLMAFNQHEIPFHVQFSTWGMCAILTIAWTRHDTLNLRPEMRRLAVFAVIVVAFLLDSAISGAFASAGNSVFATSDSPSTAFIFTTFLLPCMAMSAFLCSGMRAIYRQVVQHLAGVDTMHV